MLYLYNFITAFDMAENLFLLSTNNVGIGLFQIMATAYIKVCHSFIIILIFLLFWLKRRPNRLQSFFIPQNFGPNWRRVNDVRWQINLVNKVQYDRLLHFKRVFHRISWWATCVKNRKFLVAQLTPNRSSPDFTKSSHYFSECLIRH